MRNKWSFQKGKELSNTDAAENRSSSRNEKNKQFLGSAAKPRNSSSFIPFAESRSSFMRATMHFTKTAVRIFEYIFQPQNPRLKAHDEPLSQITANLVSKPTLMLIPGKECESFLLTPIPVFFF